MDAKYDARCKDGKNPCVDPCGVEKRRQKLAHAAFSLVSWSLSPRKMTTQLSLVHSKFAFFWVLQEFIVDGMGGGRILDS